MEVRIDADPRTSGYRLSGLIGLTEIEATRGAIMREAIEKVAAIVAERFLADHLQDVLACLNPQAVANLAVADAAGAIREALHQKLPDKIVEVVRTERDVYQRGVFGGMSRIG
jgi:hypothetical protein